MSEATAARPQPELTPLEALTVEHGLPAVALEYFTPTDAIKLVPLELCRRLKVLPLSRVGSILTVVMPFQDLATIDALRFFTSGLCVECVIAPLEDIERATTLFYGVETSNLEEVEVRYSVQDEVAFHDRSKALISKALHHTHAVKHLLRPRRVDGHRSFFVGDLDKPQLSYDEAIRAAMETMEDNAKDKVEANNNGKRVAGGGR
jgi:hypothetical protein